MSATEYNRATVRKLYEYFDCGDVAAMAALLHNDAVITEAETLPYAGDYVGPAGLVDVVTKIMSVWEDVSFKVDDVLASETRAAGFGTFSVTSRATGKRVSIKICEIWEFRGDKVSRCYPIYSDTALVLKAISA